MLNRSDHIRLGAETIQCGYVRNLIVDLLDLCNAALHVESAQKLWSIEVDIYRASNGVLSSAESGLIVSPIGDMIECLVPTYDECAGRFRCRARGAIVDRASTQSIDGG